MTRDVKLTDDSGTTVSSILIDARHIEFRTAHLALRRQLYAPSLILRNDRASDHAVICAVSHATTSTGCDRLQLCHGDVFPSPARVYPCPTPVETILAVRMKAD